MERKREEGRVGKMQEGREVSETDRAIEGAGGGGREQAEEQADEEGREQERRSEQEGGKEERGGTNRREEGQRTPAPAVGGFDGFKF